MLLPEPAMPHSVSALFPALNASISKAVLWSFGSPAPELRSFQTEPVPEYALKALSSSLRTHILLLVPTQEKDLNPSKCEFMRA